MSITRTIFAFLIAISVALLPVAGGAAFKLKSSDTEMSDMAVSEAMDARGSALLGIVFGINIPACAAPLIFALLGAAAARGVAGATLASGFISLAVFGLALSLPLAAVVLYPPARRALDWLAGLSRRIPVWTGGVLFALGVWSVWLGLFVDLKP